MNTVFETLKRSRIFRRIVFGFALIAAVLSIGLLVTLLRFVQLNDEFDGLVVEELALLDDTERIQRLLAELQSNKRGYVLTGDTEFRARFEAARGELVPIVSRVRDATAGRRIQRKLLADVLRALDSYLRESEADIAMRERVLRGELELEDVIARFRAGPGIHLADRCELALRALHTACRHSVEQQRARVVASTSSSRTLAATSMLIAAAAAVFYGWWLARDIGDALQSLGSSLDAVGRGEPAAPLPERRDEIGEVARRFEQMTERLERAEAETQTTMAELREANDTIAAAMRVKSDFLATMSHELRTPLNAVIGLSGLLLDSPAEQLSQRAKRALQTMRESGTHLLTLLDDILDMAKLDAGRMTFSEEPMSPEAIARACVATVSPLVGDKPLSMELDCQQNISSVHADPQRVRQVLLNLLANAVKFTHHGKITLRVTEENSSVHFEVADTGIGIDETQMKLLFQEFQQLDRGDSRSFGGTGLGLALSRKMARAMHGELTARSTLGVGSSFTLSLPVGERDSVKTVTRVGDSEGVA